MTWTDRNPRGETREPFRGPESKARPLGREERQKEGREEASRRARGRERAEGTEGESVEEWGTQAATQTREPGRESREGGGGGGDAAERKEGAKGEKGKRRRGRREAGGGPKDREGKGRGSDARESRGAPRWDGVLSLFFLGFWGGRRISAEITQPSPLPPVPARGRSCINTGGGGAGLLPRGQRHRRRLCCH